MQQELLPRVSADVTYFRRWYGNFVITDDLAIGPQDFDRFIITAPKDPRLPGGGGYPVEGYDIKPAKFGVAAQPYVTLSSKYGKQHGLLGRRRLHRERAAASGPVLPGRREHGTARGRQLRRRHEGGQSQPAVLPPRGAAAHAGQGLRLVHDSRVDVQFSATYQTKPGPLVLAIYTATNAEVAPSLGRNLAGARADRGRAPRRRRGCTRRRTAGQGTCTENDSTRSTCASRSCCASAAPARGRTSISTTPSTRARCWCRTTPSAPGRRRPRSWSPGSSSSACSSTSNKAVVGSW